MKSRGKKAKAIIETSKQPSAKVDWELGDRVRSELSSLIDSSRQFFDNEMVTAKLERALTFINQVRDYQAGILFTELSGRVVLPEDTEQKLIKLVENLGEVQDTLIDVSENLFDCKETLNDVLYKSKMY